MAFLGAETVEDFAAVDGCFARGVDAQADRVAADLNDYDVDVVADDDRLVSLAGGSANDAFKAGWARMSQQTLDMVLPSFSFSSSLVDLR